MALKQVRQTILILTLVIAAGLSGFWLGGQKVSADLRNLPPVVKIERAVPAQRENVDFSLFWEVWDRLEQAYLDKAAIDPAKMVYGAIAGMVSSLGDPYTAFLPPAKNKEAKQDLAGEFEGVGIQLGYKDSTLAVIAPLSGMPAEKAGVKAGDLIVNIKDDKKGIDINTIGMSLPEAVTLIRGPEGTPVILTLVREGVDEPFETEIKRGTILVKSAEVEFLVAEQQSSRAAESKVAHLKLLRFGERTNQEWEEAVNKIKNEKLPARDASQSNDFKGVVLDLRNNPGGFLSGAVWIASEFLDKDLPAGRQGIVVWQDEGNKGKESFSVNRQGKLTDVPLVVLVNEGSASASEIVAGALKHYDRAKLVGQKTFGKGSIQEAQELEGGAGLHVTIARWLLPDQTSIDKKGITPDFEVEMDKENPDTDPQLEKAIELLVR